MCAATSEDKDRLKNPLRSAKRPSYNMPPPFWLTHNGRSVMGGIGALGASVFFGGYTILHTWCLDKYKSNVHLYKHGFATPLTPDVIIRSREALMEVVPRFKIKGPELVEFFSVIGMDMFHAGSTKLKGGSIIGIPRNFTYRSKADIEKQDIVVENKHIEWGSEGGQLLQDSLILSARAQKFAIAREIAMTDTYYPYVHGGIGVGSMMTYIVATKTINSRFQGFQRPKSFRLFVYACVGTFAFGLWSTVTDLVTKHYEKKADTRAGNVGLEYAQGGVEFYAKTLQRNIALRSLMGPNGEKLFTFYGNDVEFIRQKHIPFTERKIYLEGIADKLANVGKDKESLEDAE